MTRHLRIPGSRSRTAGRDAALLGNGQVPPVLDAEPFAYGHLPPANEPSPVNSDELPPGDERHSPAKEPPPYQYQRPLQSPAANGPPPVVRQPAPASVDAITAMIRYPLLVIIPALIIGVLGAVLANRKITTYTAGSQILVGSPAPGTAGELPGVVQAEQSLASIYAREIDFDAVVRPMARRFHASRADIASRLSATPLPDAPIIKIAATADTPRRAIGLANGAGAKLASFVNHQTQSAAPANTAFGSYQQAATALARARAHQQQIAHMSLPPNSRAVLNAAADVQVAQLVQSTVGSQYQNALGTQQNTPRLNLFQSATAADSNRKPTLEIYVFGGVVAGLVIGAALATLLARRNAIRAATRAAAVA
jgi:capsular polysaccharide biosynthesis protein